MTDNPSKRINVRKTENTVTFNIKMVYYLELSTPETRKLFRSAKIKTTGEKTGENVPHSEITEVLFVHGKFFNNNYQHDSRVLSTFISNESFGQLLDILPNKIIFLRTFNLELSFIKIWFTDQNFKPLKMK